MALLLGTLLVSAGAAVHPILTGDAAAHLRLIADTPYWRPLHLVMLAGTGLVMVGIWVRVLDGAGGAMPVVAALATISIGLALNALNIAYMAGAGWHMAETFRAGNAGISALYDATHSIALMSARFGNFIVALGALALGWAEWEDATRPRWLALLAWAAAAAGLAGVIFFNEASPATLGAVAVLSVWQVVTGVRALRA